MRGCLPPRHCHAVHSCTSTANSCVVHHFGSPSPPLRCASVHSADFLQNASHRILHRRCSSAIIGYNRFFDNIVPFVLPLSPLPLPAGAAVNSSRDSQGQNHDASKQRVLEVALLARSRPFSAPTRLRLHEPDSRKENSCRKLWSCYELTRSGLGCASLFLRLELKSVCFSRAIFHIVAGNCAPWDLQSLVSYSIRAAESLTTARPAECVSGGPGGGV